MYKYILIAKKLYRFIKTGSSGNLHYVNYMNYLKNNKADYKKGIFNMTIDFELAWSRSRKGNGCTSLKESLQRSHYARKMFPEFLHLTSVFNIPVTFATIGHIALSNCKGHREPPQFNPYWLSEDWFSIDPHSDLKHSPDYYGSDLVQSMLDNRQSHEIASHGFSHIDLSDDTVTQENALFEISESSGILRGVNKNLTTFVFPNNQPAFKHLLKKTGFRIYRNNQNSEIKKDNIGLWQFPVGLWVSPYGLSSSDIIKLIDVAIQRKQMVNIWCHLYEFKNKRQLKDFFQPIFSHINKKRENGTLEVNTMSAIVDKIENKIL